ncbi:Uncharacterised protein [Mycobacteroides abscessus subsp. abscessus]|uniref:hypothetical protein n=1 Tax=Mycobacteroides abscessus TaxID=36809 RepID=UPI00092936BD|nr:hypothetical protein [Mycobacteroides abscessus]SII94932.1 Uncharacterised protein [Mycobacteroides abscessus subsp. abscessus]SIL06448.1 Uncharacterised protein [Mycobacteroides abscessus subsp. abscessus]SLK57807.1 Uncharacterised protein [Mycobacteroides abscessus subsp. abscessus]
MEDVTIYLPERSEDLISDSLRTLTRELQGITNEGALGFLGGEYGYGCDYENDVFMMHPFCWCERADCPWCLDCECPEGAEEYSVGGEVVDFQRYCDEYDLTGNTNRSFRVVPELECGSCVKRRTIGFAPNFLFKPTGAKVRWYKYIGRSMKVDGEFPADFLSTCLKSVAQ